VDPIPESIPPPEEDCCMAGGGAVWVGAGCVVVEVDAGRRDDVVTDGEGRETALRRERCGETKNRDCK